MIRNRLKVLRAEREISQDDTAMKAGIERNRYWRIEKGYIAATPEERSQLGIVFGVDDAALGFEELSADDASELTDPAADPDAPTEPSDLTVDAVRSGR